MPVPNRHKFTMTATAATAATTDHHRHRRHHSRHRRPIATPSPGYYRHPIA
jgi:hypothetical protein